MDWTTKKGLKIPIKDLTDEHLNKIINMYDSISERLPYEENETALNALKKANPDQAEILQALYDEHDLRNH